VPTKTLEEQTLILVNQWEQLNDGLMFYTDKTHAMDWLVKAGKTKIKAFGQGNEIDNRSLHGELRILKHIVDNNIQPKDKHKGNGDYKKVIRLGGTQLDCSDCHQMEHGGIDGSGDSIHGNYHDGTDSFDKILGQRGFQVLSPGTHGAAFNGWVHPIINDKKNRYPGKVNNDIKPLGNKLLGGLYRDKKMSDHMKQEQLPILKSEIQFADQRLGLTTKLPNNRLTVEQQHNQMVASLKNNLYPKLEKKILAYKSTISQYEQRLGIRAQQNDEMNICRRFDYYKAQAESLQNKTRGFEDKVIALYPKAAPFNKNIAPKLSINSVATLLGNLQEILNNYQSTFTVQQLLRREQQLNQQIVGLQQDKTNIQSRQSLVQNISQLQQMLQNQAQMFNQLATNAQQLQQQKLQQQQQNSYFNPSNINRQLVYIQQQQKRIQQQVQQLSNGIQNTQQQLAVLPMPTYNMQQINLQQTQLLQQLQPVQQSLQPFRTYLGEVSELLTELQNYQLQLANM
jgi:hypothetical protein